MAKAVKRPIIIESESEDSDSDNQDTISAAKRLKALEPAAQSSGSGSSSDSDGDAEWTLGSKESASGVKKSTSAVARKGRGGGGGKTMVRKSMGKKLPQPSSSESSEEDDDEEDGEGQRSTDSSSSSGSGSSFYERSPSPFSDGLDDQLMGDEEDQKKLGLMNERDREIEMFKRFEKREALKARFEIEKKLYRQRKHDKERQREQQKRSLRRKRSKQQDRNKSQAMNEYKAKRSADKIRKAEAEKEPLKASDIFASESEEESSSSDDSDSYQNSEDEAGTKTLSGLKDAAPQYISTGHELSKIRLSRYRLEKWVHMPFFTEAAVGCFVRIGIGANEGRMVYRICEIIGVQETPKVYSLGSTKTNKGLKLRHALQERVFRMEYVSNSQFTDSEFHKWKTEMEKRGLQLPTVDYVRRKARKLEEMKNVSLKEEDVAKIIQEKQRFKKNPSNYAMTKSRLLREKETAEEEGDVEKTRNLIDKLNELEERADQLDKQRSKGLSAISYINERNRQRNVTRAELALKEELAAGEGKADDPFTRRKCQPKLVTLAVREPGASELIQQLSQAQQTTSKDGDKSKKLPAVATPNGQERKAPGVPEATPSTGLSATPAPPKSEQFDDLFSAHDFDIQIDLPSAGNDSATPKMVSKPTANPKQNAPKRSLNLSDYKKRRGLI